MHLRSLTALGLAGLTAAVSMPARAAAPGCEACPSTCIYHNVMTWHPGTVTNAVEGDIIATTKGDMVPMLRVGFVFSHLGIMLDTNRARHTTMSFENIPSFKGNFFQQVWAMINNTAYGIAHLGPGELYNGAAWPDNWTHGSVTTNVDSTPAFGFSHLFGTYYSITLSVGNAYASWYGLDYGSWRATQALLKPVSDAKRSDANTVLSWLLGHPFYYRVHAFYMANTAGDTGGAGCSSAIAYASQHSLPSDRSIPTWTMPAQVVSIAILNLRTFLYEKLARPKISADASSLASPGVRDSAGWSIADQVVNCFAYDQTGQNWGWGTGCSRIDETAMMRARMTLSLWTPSWGDTIYTSSAFNTAVSAGPFAAASTVSPDHIILSGGRATANSQLTAENVATAAQINAASPFAWGLKWFSADIPSVTSYLPQQNSYEGFQAGPWNGAPLINPTYSGGYWAYEPWGQCPVYISGSSGWCGDGYCATSSENSYMCPMDCGSSGY